VLFLQIYLFIRERERERESQADSLLSSESKMGLDPMTPRSKVTPLRDGQVYVPQFLSWRECPKYPHVVSFYLALSIKDSLVIK